MTRTFTFLLLAAALAAGSAQAKPASKPSEDKYTDAQFKSDCELSGGKPSIDGKFVSCDYPTGTDILCDRGRKGIYNCESGYVMHRPSGSRPRPAPLGTVLKMQIAR